MKKIIVLIILFIVFIYSARYFNPKLKDTPIQLNVIQPKTTNIQAPPVAIVAQDLDTPWSIAFIPDGRMLATERKGTVRLDGQPISDIKGVLEIGEGGLLGLTLHPDFANNHYVYVYYTYTQNGDNTFNRVSRMSYENNTLSNEVVLIDAIPGASNHNGGRIKFGPASTRGEPDNLLYITTGDAQEPSQSQNINSLAGKILRVNDDGTVAFGNPFNNLVYSYGHRNPQGLAWDSQGNLWATEHGQSGLDEINLIESGNNYGWPDIEGNKTAPDMVTPVVNSGNTTWAPADAVFVGSSLFFTGLRGTTLYEAVIENRQVVEIKEHFNGQFGRLREIVLGPDNLLYVTTSNKDGRGMPKEGDDKIIRINPSLL
ncbi:PQQ-dependent sugar dehydrogenase [Candidatus Gottesmanbacteria bacterium]|nr:PQQ-dependent sugar dehydrogenase [Candidatus Gottesmanbacteria bacterium]